MRIYENCYELMSEIQREVFEMGHICKPKSMQNKNIEGNDDFITKEIINYTYCLQSRDKEEYLFLSDPRSIDWVKVEFFERIDPNKINNLSHSIGNPGEAWMIRPELWKPLMNDRGQFDYVYGQRMNNLNSLNRIIAELKRNPDSRQLVLSIWDRIFDIDGLGGERRIPCSVYYQFLCRDGKVNIIYNQRSADVVTHFGNDVWLAWELMKYVAEVSDFNIGYLYHNIASLHAYKKDWVILKQCIEDLKNGTQGK